MDGSHPDPEGQISAVREVLAEVGGDDIKEVIVINKADIAHPEVLTRLRRHEKHSIAVSARTGEGIGELRELIARELPKPDIEVEALVPYDRGDLLSKIHEEGEILESEHVEDGTRVRARVTPAVEALVSGGGPSRTRAVVATPNSTPYAGLTEKAGSTESTRGG